MSGEEKKLEGTSPDAVLLDETFNGVSPQDFKLERELKSDLELYKGLGGAAGVAAKLKTDLQKGLTNDQASDANRLRIFGNNVYPKPPLRSYLSHCWEQMQDPMLVVLIIAGILAIIVGAIHDPHHGWVEGLAIQFAVVIVVTVGAFNNWSQERTFRAQEDKKKQPTITVYRGGELQILDHDQVVVGDLVNLKSGDTIPADGVVIESDSLDINEASMTGESIYITKHPTKDPFLRAATEVKKGTGKMIVTATGTWSSYGEIMKFLAVEIEETALQLKLNKLATLIGYVGTGVAVVLFLALLAFWIADCETGKKSYSGDGSDILTYFIVAITIIVVAVPEGLPLAVTVALAYSMAAMEKDNNLVKVLSACETMGNVTAICSDKTGTLTTGKMTVVKEYIAGELCERKVPQTADFKKLFEESIILSSTVVYADGDDHDPDAPPENWNWVNGNQTEASMLAFVCRCYGTKIITYRESDTKKIVKMFPFDSQVKRSGMLMRIDGGYRLYLRGAAERIIAQCTKIYQGDGKTSALDQKVGIAQMNGMSLKGLRTIGVCYSDFKEDDIKFNEEGKVESVPEREDRVLISVLGLQDPLRDSTATSVDICKRAGVVVRMVTGDHLNTARFIAHDCGILTNNKQISMEGKDFRKLLKEDKKACIEMLPMLRVLARSQPADKMDLINLLKEQGEVVGATGDGTNDAAALKAANVGLAMDIAGTEIAKRAADIVILDDSFASIVMAIKWGRAIYDNISKFVQFQVTVNVTALVVSLIGALAGFEIPLTAVQLLWVNMIMDTFAALALATEHPTDVLLERRPFGKEAFLIRPVMWRFILGQALLQLIVLFTMLFGASLFAVEERSKRHYTMIFNTFVFLQIFNEINARKVCGELNIFAGFFNNWLFQSIILGTIGAQILIVEFAGDFASTTSLTLPQWGICIGLGLLSIPWHFLLRVYPINLAHGQIPVNPDLSATDVDFNVADSKGAAVPKPSAATAPEAKAEEKEEAKKEEAKAEEKKAEEKEADAAADL